MRLMAIGLLAVGLTVAVVEPAAASTPTAPTHVRVSSISRTSFTVSMRGTSSATAYRVYVSNALSGLSLGSVSTRKHATSRRPSVVIAGLTYTSTTLYYRAETIGRHGHSFDPSIRTVHLQPPRPTRFAAHHNYLSWAPEQTSNGFVITQATNAAMTRDRIERYVSAGNTSFAPYGVVKGVRYWYQIRARNGSTVSRYSGHIGMTPVRAQTAVKVMTYNVLESTFDGTHDGGATGPVIAPWSRRRSGAADLILSQRPDVVAVEEAAAWVTPVHGRGGVRQIDDLLSLVPGYALARTEIPPSEPHYQRTGDYVLLKSSSMTSDAEGGHWAIGDGRWAAYQLVRSARTGARFLMVVPHLLVGTGAQYDRIRQKETTLVIGLARDYASHYGGVPVVYGGDFNSSASRVSHVFDGTAIAMRAVGNVDAIGVAQTTANAPYNSSNRYLRTPPAHFNHIDAIFTSPDVAVRSWGLVVKLSAGKFDGTIPSDHNPIWSVLGIAQ